MGEELYNPLPVQEVSTIKGEGDLLELFGNPGVDGDIFL